MSIATPFVQIVQMKLLSVVQTDKLEKNGKKVLTLHFECGKLKMSSRERQKIKRKEEKKMITISKAKELTEQATAKRLVERVKQAEKFCNSIVENAIIERANKGISFSARIEIPSELYVNVVNIIRANGYNVTRYNDNIIQISWNR